MPILGHLSVVLMRKGGKFKNRSFQRYQMKSDIVSGLKSEIIDTCDLVTLTVIYIRVVAEIFQCC